MSGKSDDEAPLEIETATLYIFNPSGVLIDTLPGDCDHCGIFEIPENTLNATGMNWIFDFEFTLNLGAPMRERKLVNVVKYLISCPVSTADILGKYPMLKDRWEIDKDGFQGSLTIAFNDCLKDIRKIDAVYYPGSMIDSNRLFDIVVARFLMDYLHNVITDWVDTNPFVKLQEKGEKDYSSLVSSTTLFLDTTDSNIVNAEIPKSLGTVQLCQ